MAETRLVTVLGNLSVDHVDDGPPSPGGCPSFAGTALADLGERARIVTRAAPEDLPLFEPMLAALPVPWQVLPAACTSAFELRYRGDDRQMNVTALGPVWTPDDIAAAAPDSPWVHVAPLLRSDFPVETLIALASGDRLISFDGQGLVRHAEVGPLRFDSDFDRGLLGPVSVLKLADEEAEVVAGGRAGANARAGAKAPAFGSDVARSLGVAEIMVTSGSNGCLVFAGDDVLRVPAAWRVLGAQSTGAGDIFVTSYVAARANGAGPARAAEHASRFVAEQLQARVAAKPAGPPRPGDRPPRRE